MASVQPLLRAGALKTLIKRSYHGPGDIKPATMNDLPIPSGSWKTNYDAKNSKYNLHLLFGITFAAVTLITAKSSGLINLNYSRPKSLD